MATPENLLLARLDGTARRLVQLETPTDEAAAELRAITTDTTLLERAAGTALARWQAFPVKGNDSRAAAELLVAAGADRDRVADQAREHAQREMASRDWLRSKGVGGTS